MSLATLHKHYPSAFAEGEPQVPASRLQSPACWSAVVWVLGVQGAPGHSPMTQASNDKLPKDESVFFLYPGFKKFMKIKSPSNKAQTLPLLLPRKDGAESGIDVSSNNSVSIFKIS